MKRLGAINDIGVSLRASISAELVMTADTIVTIPADTVDSNTGIEYDNTTYTAILPKDGFYTLHVSGTIASADANTATVTFVIDSKSVNGIFRTPEPFFSYYSYFSAGTTVIPKIKHLSTTKNLATGAIFTVVLHE